MSAICIVNLKRHSLNYNEMNLMSKDLIRIALLNDVSVFFHSYDYGEKIIKSAQMQNFFLMSDSFLYKNCEFLNSEWFLNSEDDLRDEESTKQAFMQRYHFFEEIIKKIFKYNVKEIEIYISGEIYSVSSNDDFIRVGTSEKDFLNKLFESLEDKLQNDFNYSFKNVVFEITK